MIWLGIGFALGFICCTFVVWLAGDPPPDEPRARGNPAVCRYCGCAHPLGEQNPARDPGLGK